MLQKYKFIFLTITLFSSLNANSISQDLTKIINGAFAKQESLTGIIDLAIDNKMLSQKMAKCAVLIKNDIHPELNAKILLESAKKFDSFIDGMYHGNKSLNLKKATNPQIVKELNEVNEVWKKFYAQVKILYKDKKFNTDAYKYIIEENEKLLRISHKLTQSIQSKTLLNTYANKVIVNTLKFADRQKMLSQKMLKEKFLVYTNENKKRNNVRLRGSIILFKNGLNGLLNGDNKRGIAKVTNKKIQAKLKDMLSLYKKAEELYKTQPINEKEIEKLVILDKKLLKLSIDVVTMTKNTLIY